jgi:hypothetical protein
MTPKALGKVKVKRLAKLSDDINFVRDVTALTAQERYARAFYNLFVCVYCTGHVDYMPSLTTEKAFVFIALAFLPFLQGKGSEPVVVKTHNRLCAGRGRAFMGQRTPGDSTLCHIRAYIYRILTQG